MTFAEIAQADALEWARRVDEHLEGLEPLLAEGTVIAAAADQRIAVPSPRGLAPSYPGLRGPVIAVLRAQELRGAIEHWRKLKEGIR